MTLCAVIVVLKAIEPQPMLEGLYPAFSGS